MILQLSEILKTFSLIFAFTYHSKSSQFLRIPLWIQIISKQLIHPPPNNIQAVLLNVIKCLLSQKHIPSKIKVETKINTFFIYQSLREQKHENFKILKDWGEDLLVASFDGILILLFNIFCGAANVLLFVCL